MISLTDLTQAPPTQPNPNADAHLSGLKGNDLLNALKSGDTQTAPTSGYNPVSSFSKNFTDAADTEGKTWIDFPSNASTDIHQIANGFQSGEGQGLKGVGKEIVGAGAGTVNLLGDSIKALLAPVSAFAQGTANTLSDIPAVQSAAALPGISNVADATNAASKKLDTWSQANPNKAKTLSSAANIVMALLGEATGAPEENAPSLSETAGNVKNDITGAASKIKESLTPVPKAPVPEPITPEQQALADAQTKATQTQTEANSKLTEAQTKATQAQTEAQAATQARETASSQAVQGVKDINTNVAAHKATLGEQFASDASKLEKTNPNLKLNLTNDQIKALNSLKEGKNFVLPKSLDLSENAISMKGNEVNLGPNVRSQLESELGKAGATNAIELSPTQTQELIRELNRSTYKEMADGTRQIDYQRLGITNEIKNSASEAFGKPWDNIYSKYAQGRTAIDKIDSFVNLDPRATAADLNKQLETVLKQSKTPEGKLLLQQSLNEYKQTSGIDLTNPVKAIQQIADKDAAVEATQDNVSAAQKNVTETQKSGEKEVSTAQKDVAKAQAEVEKMDKMKMTTAQKVEKLVKTQGGRWASYALRFILIREAYKLLTTKK